MVLKIIVIISNNVTINPLMLDLYLIQLLKKLNYSLILLQEFKRNIILKIHQSLKNRIWVVKLFMVVVNIINQTIDQLKELKLKILQFKVVYLKVYLDLIIARFLTQLSKVYHQLLNKNMKTVISQLFNVLIIVSYQAVKLQMK